MGYAHRRKYHNYLNISESGKNNIPDNYFPTSQDREAVTRYFKNLKESTLKSRGHEGRVSEHELSFAVT